MKFELTNEQRPYFGLEPVKPEWDRVILKGDTYREESILYFEGDYIKRYIISTEFQYKESQYNELTRSRNILLPVTAKGKEKKLTASVLESRQPTGLYCVVDSAGRILIGNFNTQTSFYDSSWEQPVSRHQIPIKNQVEIFIDTTPEGYLAAINGFKKGKRKNAKFKPGDFFAFKINREEYGFGRILLNIDELKKKNIITKNHGLSLIMTKPVLVKIYTYISKVKDIEIEKLKDVSALPSDYMMDNAFFYGEYEVIGHKQLESEDFDFPISYGRHIDFSKHCAFFQWGLIHCELSTSTFNKYFVADNPLVPVDSQSRKTTNPYGYYSIGFRPKYSGADIKEAIANNGKFDFEACQLFGSIFDLRNPGNKEIRKEIMTMFGLDPAKSYNENCKLTNTMLLPELITVISK